MKKEFIAVKNIENIKGNRLKDNQGFALSAVLVLIAVLTLFGTAMYSYSLQSLNTIKWGTDAQKAEYLARAGVEAATYRYQNAIQTSYTNGDVANFINDGLAKGMEIKSSRVYLLKDGVTYTETEPKNDDDYIGYFEVTITNDHRGISVPALDNKTVSVETKVFTSIGHVKGKSAVREGYITPTSDGYRSNWYGNDGLIKTDLPESDTVVRKENGVSGTYTFSIQILSLKLNLFQKTFTSDINHFVGYGNLVLSAPTDENENEYPIHPDENDDEFVSFVSMRNLFLNSDLNVTPNKGNYQAVGLAGNEIVVNGDINMGVYYCSGSLASSLFNTLVDNMYLGTVIINSPSSAASTVTDPSSNGCGDCGKIYFNGNVYVNIYVPNEGMKKYKVFSSGDVYYFDKNCKNNATDEDASGIDLLKYFLDTSIEKGNFDSSSIARFKAIREVYYESTSHITKIYTAIGDHPSMRKIDIEKNKNVDRIQDVIPPAAIDSADIVWTR